MEKPLLGSLNQNLEKIELSQAICRKYKIEVLAKPQLARFEKKLVAQ